jgi:hypothetical protein
VIVSILVFETSKSMLTYLYHLANHRVFSGFVRDVSIGGASKLFSNWMAQPFLALPIQALADTWWNLLFMEQVLFVSDNTPHNIVPYVKIEMTVNKNLRVGYFLIVKDFPLVSG